MSFHKTRETIATHATMGPMVNHHAHLDPAMQMDVRTLGDVRDYIKPLPYKPRFDAVLVQPQEIPEGNCIIV